MVREHLEVEVKTHPPVTTADPEEQHKVHTLVGKFRDLVFDDNKVGCLKIEPIHLGYAKISSRTTAIQKRPVPLSR